MRWIERHWEVEYIELAKHVMRETVCVVCYSPNSFGLIHYTLKMTRYRGRLPVASDAATSSQQSTQRTDIWATASRYKLDDMLNFGEQIGLEPRTIDEEFEQYTKDLSPMGTSMLEFWDVSYSST